MAGLAFERVTKVFPDGTAAVRELDLDVGDGELMILVGPSGSGKSTALRMLAGLEDATSGTIRIGSRVVNDVAPKDRDIAMVFQSYALYPHMDVASNLGFALRMKRMERSSIAARVSAAAQRLGLSDLVARRPRQLSGGQRQRVAVGRAIVREPQAFLMDEPLSNLDAKLRVEMRAYLARLRQELGTTTVYVTHDQIEAMTMGDRVAVMRDGRLEQCDHPQALYDRPTNLFVAGFIGSPAMNFVRGSLEHCGTGAGVDLVLGGQRLRLPAQVPDAVLARGGSPVVVGIRPEALRAVSPGTDDEHVLHAPVVLVESLGSDLLVHAELDAPAVLTEDQLEVAREVGGDPAADQARARVTARLMPDVRVAAGDRVRLDVDVARLHFFDPETTLALR
jgi:multiple sugar transport system ATP-binding protein